MMKLRNVLAGVGVIMACAVSGASGQAPSFYVFNFRGVEAQTNGTGAIQSKSINERTLLQEIAQRAGVAASDTKNWVLAYHVHGNDLGDTIDVVDKTTGAVLDTFLGLYFGQTPELGRVGLTNRVGTQEMRIDYLYTKQNSHSMGAALVNKLHSMSGGTVLRSRVYGPMEWVWKADQFGGTRMYTGTFTTGVPYNFTK